jgi:NADH:ubiquinone oxidoreductase subunit F (NADH-binding)
MDAALLQLRPHLVLDGLALAAETLGARDAVVWLHEGDHVTHQAVSRALAERRSASDLGLVVRIAEGPDHYLSGESSAVVRALSGGPALPYLARRPAAVHGVGGRPTLLHNADTLARVALVARFGLDADTGGALVTVVGPSRRVVLGLPAGETFARLLARTGVVGGVPQAVLVGGYGGSWLPWSQVAAVQVCEAGLRPLGASLGAGVVAPLPAGACGLAETANLVAFLAASSARQCGPCMFGLPAVADLVGRLAAGRAGRADLKALRRYAGEVAGRGACHHPDGAVRLVSSALRVFEADVRRHLSDGPCAGASGPALLPVPEVG